MLFSDHAFAQILLSQQQCREMASKSNEELQKANNAQEQARLEKAIAFASYFPELDGNATGIYKPKNLEIMNMDLQIKGTYMAGISLTQPVYTGGKITASNKMAKIKLASSEESIRLTKMHVIADADKAYWTYVAVNEKVRMLESYYNQLDILYKQTENSVKVEMTTENELLRIGAKRSQIRYQLQKAENGAELCRLSLCNVIGVDLETAIAVADTTIVITTLMQTVDDISMRPELKLAEKRIELDEQQVKLARANLLPTVALSAQYSRFGGLKYSGMVDNNGEPAYFSNNVNNGSSMFMLSVNIPLFHWGKETKKVKQAKIQLANSRLDLQQDKRLFSIELQQAIRNVHDCYNMIQTADTGMEVAKESLRIMKKRYQTSMCSLTDLLDAQTQWHEAYSNYIEAQTQYKISETEYLKAAGILQ